MTKKSFLYAMIFVALIAFSGCPDKDTSIKGEKEFEKIPNSMKKAVSELEQVVTLLGGPMFNGRDAVEQLKSQQIQALINEISEKKEDSSTGMESTGQNKDSTEKQNQDKKTNENQDKEQGNEKNNDETGKDEESKEGESSNSSDSPESAGKDEKESTQDENTTKEFESQRPADEQEKIVDFQFEDSLFGIPQWQENNWKMIQVLSDGMYFTWNSIQPDLLEKGISSEQIEDFGTALANLSKAIKNKNINNAQISAFKLTQINADFFSYYKTNIPSEVQSLKSTVTGINFYVKQKDWDKTQDIAIQLQQELIKLKSNVEDNKSYLFRMLELSILDLEKSIQEQNPDLVLIRTNLVTSNIQELESELSQVQGSK